MKKYLRFFTAAAVAVIAAAALHAAPSPDGFHGPKEYVNRPAGISSQDYRAMTTGTQKVAVILVDFPSAGSDTTDPYNEDGKMSDADIQNIDAWFKTDSSNFEDYFSESSYGRLDIDIAFAVEGGTTNSLSVIKSSHCFTMNNSMAYYGDNEDSYPDRLAGLISGAVTESGVSSADYDYVVVVHAGYGNESTRSSPDYNDIWSLSLSWTGQDANGFYTGVIVPAREFGGKEPFGVYCHEFGHQLGLPDIYDTNSGNSLVGQYALMDSGCWNDNGKTPSHFCSWSKKQLGWLTPLSVTADVQALQLSSYYNNSAAYRFSVNPNEYFLLSYRKKFGYDSALTSEGPVFLHVDDNIGDIDRNNINCGDLWEHPRVDIVGAGVWDVNEVFTAPDSDGYDGNVSGITVYNFSTGPDYLNFSATIAEFTAEAGFKEKPLNFPNPAKGVSATTISFMLEKPETDKVIRIYTPSGDLVKKIESDDIKAVYVQDNEVVYQAGWNLKNEAGENVASGIYIYLVEAGSKKEFGHLAVIK